MPKRVDHPIILGIVGDSASGKTTLSAVTREKSVTMRDFPPSIHVRTILTSWSSSYASCAAVSPC
jgi:dephospho-CoA kinase